MPSDVALMWFRRDLRVHDLPALTAAAKHAHTVPVFVVDDRLITKGRFPCAKRVAFMLGCLRELDEALRARGGRLVIREGKPEEAIPALAREAGAGDVYLTGDCSPWARRRDQAVIDALAADGVRAHVLPGSAVVDDPAKVLTRQGRPYTVFSPFAKTWREVPRRDPAPAPRTIALPSSVRIGRLPSLDALGVEDPGELVFTPGETAGRAAMAAFLRDGLGAYAEARDVPAGGSSRLSPYLRWGCVSPLELEQAVAAHRGAGAADYRTELAWRDFYAAVLMHFPFVTRQEFQERYRSLSWSRAREPFTAWREGRTGYPLVDAGMRQLLAEGWMHNRVRMVVGSFLTKDLHLNWRWGEAHFMRELVDGDMAANNGGWQWIASTGTDPAPYFQRMFNPITQQRRHDPDGTYVRRWVPELADVPTERIFEPWAMSAEEQEAAGCVIGRDYPAPIVEHADERRRAIERYRAAG